MVEHPSDEFLSAYADNELEADDGEALARHLETCATCRQRLSELDWARQRLVILRQESWHPDVYPQVISRIAGGERIWWLRRVATQVAAAASMALVLVVMGAAMVILLESRPQQQAEVPLSPDTAKALKERPEGKVDLSSVSGLVYIVDQGDPLRAFSSQILVFDPARGEIVRKIPVGASAQVVASPQGDRLYVSSLESKGRVNQQYLKVLDARSGRELARLEAQDKTPLALSLDGRLLYLLHVEQIGNTTRRHLNVFDTRALRMLPYDVPSDPTAFRLDSSVIKGFISPDGDWLYTLGALSDPGIARVEFLDVAGREVVDTLELPSEELCGPFSYTGVLSPDGQYLYAVNTLEEFVVVVDVNSRSIVRSAVFDSPRSSWTDRLLQPVRDLFISTAWAKGCFPPPGVTISPDGSKIYVG
ncbi:MAG: zf-HC2 domain-containing protein, partial [Chloroflexi bacterium]|nr:zf-HC2 domain-containing protein [Chloroflexota bacterium]